MLHDRADQASGEALGMGWRCQKGAQAISPTSKTPMRRSGYGAVH
jgi:hypothetical protein